MPTTQTITYDKWDKGEFGTIAPSLAPAGSWTGSDAVVYKTGYIGPRPGLRKAALTVPGGAEGVIRGLGFMPVSGSTTKTHWFIVDNDVYLVRPDHANSSITTCSTALSGAPTAGDFAVGKESTRQINGLAYFVLPGGKVYTVDPTLGVTALTQVAASPTGEGTDIEVYRDRLTIAGADTVTFSDASAFGTWPAPNYNQVGYSWGIKSLQWFRDSLVVFTQSGTWVFTGSLGSSEVLRRISDTLAPSSPTAVVQTNDELFYIPSSRSAPVVFNGSYGDEQSLRHLEVWATAGRTVHGTQSYGNRDVFFGANSSKALWRKNYAWTQHDFSFGVGGVSRLYDDVIVIASEGDDSPATAPDFYTLDCTLDRPANTTDTYARPGDNSSTRPVSATVTLPDYFDPQGRDIRVRQVIVDFISYDTGVAAGTDGNNILDVGITPLSRFDLPGDGTEVNGQDSSGLIFYESPASSSASGTHSREVYNHGATGYSSGYRLELSMRGVTVKKVHVIVEVSDNTPRR